MDGMRVTWWGARAFHYHRPGRPRTVVSSGVDQGAFFCGDQDQSNRQGFLFWNGDKLYGVKW